MAVLDEEEQERRRKKGQGASKIPTNSSSRLELLVVLECIKINQKRLSIDLHAVR